jgi:hypothetical protein
LIWINNTKEDFGPVLECGASALRAYHWQRGNPMIIKKLILCCGIIALAGPAYAQVELKSYADGDGYIDVQALTCAQLANTFQEDADYLTTWYSGWYNGLGKKHMMKVDRAKSLEHELIVYCKANQGKKVIQAIDVVFKAYRAEKGIKMKE